LFSAYRCTQQLYSTLTRRPALRVSLSPVSLFLSLTLAPAAPEVTEGPYYLVNDLVRQDIRENQGGIPLRLDIGILDTSTCKPLPNVLVEIWHANATGYYSSVPFCLSTIFLNSIAYPYSLPNSGFGTGSSTGSGNGSGGGNNSSSTANGPPSGNAQSGASMTPGAAPSGSGTGGGGGGGSSKANTENFLRGGWQTNDNGLVEIVSVYPGFCK
jgi:hypothetical protein